MERKPVSFKLELVTIPGTSIQMERLVDFKHPLIPLKQPNYLFRQNLVEEVAYAVIHETNCLLVGDTGDGKTSLIVQLAAILNRPCVRINVNNQSDPAILIGRDMPVEVEGTRMLTYRWGPLPKMMVQPYGWFILDEMDAAQPGVLLVLQQMLEKNGKLILEDASATMVERAMGFMFFATGNSIGIAGRHRTMYAGTNRTNEATLDRFDCVVHVTEMDVKLEEEVVGLNAPELDRDFVKAVVRIAHEVRDQLRDDQLSCTFSTRRCIQWAQAMCHFHPLQAARLSVLNKLNAEDCKVLEGVIQRYFGNN